MTIIYHKNDRDYALKRLGVTYEEDTFAENILTAILSRPELMVDTRDDVKDLLITKALMDTMDDSLNFRAINSDWNEGGDLIRAKDNYDLVINLHEVLKYMQTDRASALMQLTYDVGYLNAIIKLTAKGYYAINDDGNITWGTEVYSKEAVANAYDIRAKQYCEYGTNMPLLVLELYASTSLPWSLLASLAGLLLVSINHDISLPDELIAVMNDELLSLATVVTSNTDDDGKLIRDYIYWEAGTDAEAAIDTIYMLAEHVRDTCAVKK